ncbi:OmpA family protein [Trichloromonas sp.]|uniref:OmpA family protein n=1 Tax=Trichloromonas sp. TaxID=3069249 RepID=UPI002A4A9271|nr:OmpA family protein [Trichloromonas sp.]
MKIFSLPLMLLLGVSVVGGLLFGCSPAVRENAMLEQARSAFAAAQADPDVQKNAPLELQKAKVDLEKAEKSLKEGAEAPEVEHFAYLAKQRSAIAREAANVKLAEQAVDAASAERSTVLLKARTLEADQAVRLAEAQKREAVIAGERAEAARLQAGAMTAEAEKAKAEALAAEAQMKKLQAQIAELQATQSERGLVITLGDVLFDTNKSELRSGARYTIDKLAAFLAEYPTRNVLIEGFTDSTGSVEYNQRLSERRAEAVRNVLAAQGIDPRRLMTRGYGVEYPVAGNETAEGRQCNRRVEVIISDEDGRIMERKY